MSKNVSSQTLLEKEILNLVRERGTMYETNLINEVCHTDDPKEYIKTQKLIHKLCNKGDMYIGTSPMGKVVSVVESLH